MKSTPQKCILNQSRLEFKTVMTIEVAAMTMEVTVMTMELRWYVIDNFGDFFLNSDFNIIFKSNTIGVHK